MVFFKKWLQNHQKFLLHFLIHIDVINLYFHVYVLVQVMVISLQLMISSLVSWYVLRYRPSVLRERLSQRERKQDRKLMMIENTSILLNATYCTVLYSSLYEFIKLLQYQAKVPVLYSTGTWPNFIKIEKRKFTIL